MKLKLSAHEDCNTEVANGYLMEIEYVRQRDVFPSVQTLAVDSSVEKTVDGTVEKILSVMRKNPQITQKELLLTNLSRRGIEWNFRELKDKGRITQVGGRKNGRWTLIDTHSDAEGK